MLPPWDWTMARAIDMPRPVEPVRRSREESPRAKRSKRRSRTSGAIPGPSSWMRTMSVSPSRASVVVTWLPAGVWTRALARRLTTT